MNEQSRQARAFLMTEAEKVLAFPEGCLVRVKPEQLSSFHTAEAKKMTDRIGEVTGHRAFVKDPIVTFHAVGRRSLHQRAFSYCWNYLDVITDPAEIAEWRRLLAEKAQKALLAKARSGIARG